METAKVPSDLSMGGGLEYIAEPLRPLAVPLASVNLDAANARLHPEKNMAAIRASLTRWGQRLPIVVQREGMVVRAGNGRVVAARAMGWTHIAAVIVDESQVEATAFAIADNRSAELAEWEDATLADVLKGLPDDLRLASGFDDDELGELLNRLAPEVVEDEAPEPLPNPVSRTGDLWLLGEHRLLCGDSTNGGEVSRLMDGEMASLVYTDPPYGVDYDGGTVVREKLAGDESTGLYEPACRMAADFSDDKAALYLWHAGVKGIAAAAAGYEIRCEIVWNKNLAQFGALSAQYKQKHEPCYYCFKHGTPPRWFGPTNETTVWDCDRSQVNEFHPTQKPVKLAARAMRNSSEYNGLVADWFSGSGSTLIAAEQLHRRCFAIEISPVYVDVAVRRWEKLTGKQATLEATGRTWAEVAEERGVMVPA